MVLSSQSTEIIIFLAKLRVLPQRYSGSRRIAERESYAAARPAEVISRICVTGSGKSASVGS
jgi:hypothetical protein